MCGIAGAYCTGDYDRRLDIALPLLGVFMEDRGDQSWGWTNGAAIDKHVGGVRYSMAPEHLGNRMTLLHTRLATFGEKTADNSHPFSIKGIIGVHNGMIYNHKAIATKYQLEYKVDSEVIFHQIADGRPTAELDGYGAIVYFRDGIIHIGTFSNRGDMALAKTDFGWVWASTEAAVKNALGIAGVHIQYFAKMKHGVLYQLLGDRIVRTLTPLTIGENKPATGSSWQDFKDGWQGHGYSAYSSYLDNKYNAQHGVQGEAGKFGKMQQVSGQYPLLNEPTSDADEVVDVEDGSTAGECDYCHSTATHYIDKDLMCDDCAEGAQSGKFDHCDYCGLVIVGLASIVNGETVCADCVEDRIAAEVEQAVAAGDDEEYHFSSRAASQHDADECLMCDDCVRVFELDDVVYTDATNEITTCGQCYDRNYGLLSATTDEELVTA